MKARLASLVVAGLLFGPAAGAAAPDAAPEKPQQPPAPKDRDTGAPLAEGRGAVVIWPVLTPLGDDASPVVLHKPRATETQLFERAQELEATLRDGAQDLGFTLDVAGVDPAPGKTRDLDLVERAAKDDTHKDGVWVLSPRIEYAGGGSYIIRMVAVPPAGHSLRVRVEKVAAADVAARGLVMLRELVLVTTKAPLGAKPDLLRESAGLGVVASIRSPGRAVLAANGALFGGFVAYGIQRSSSSEDPRLLYPLLALGTGAGLGITLLAAEEWDISTGDAWTLAGGAWWGTASGLLIADGRHVMPFSDRYAWGIGGGLVGVSAGIFALTRKTMDEGDATLTNSGGAFGLVLGSMGDVFYRGTLDARPFTGAGYGTAIGALGAGAASVFTRTSASRVLLVDLGAGVGALAGAAAGSPLVFEKVTPEKTRGFLGITTAGTLAGAGVAWYLTRGKGQEGDRKAARILPMGGVIGESAGPSGSVPAYGVGARGVF